MKSIPTQPSLRDAPRLMIANEALGYLVLGNVSCGKMALGYVV